MADIHDGADAPLMWKQVEKKGVVAKLVIPLFSSKYKTNVTKHCIKEAMREGFEVEDSDDPALWEPPEAHTTFKWDSFLNLYYVHLHRAAPALFHHLRVREFGIDDSDYHSQFSKDLVPVSGLGFSGSIFFLTEDKSLLIKSINRRFEYKFLYEELIGAYGKYMRDNPKSLLCRITDVLYSFHFRLGSLLGSPSHYVVMKNSLQGLDEDNGCAKWDLKPQNFFEPTRDLVPDNLKSEAAKSGLADEFTSELLLTKKQKEQLMFLIKQDVDFLTSIETIDYSLLLGRYPIGIAGDVPKPESFFSGVTSADGKWVYKMCIVDFMWNTKQLHPKIIQIAGTALPEQTVTTEPGRYMEEFLKMVEDYITVLDDGSQAFES